MMHVKRSVAVLVAAVALACAALAGCSRVGGSGKASGNPWTRHGVVRIASLNEPDSLNPLVGNYQIDSDLAQLWGGLLFNWSDANAFVPELATVVPTLANGGISRDGKTIVYHLRPGVRWQDGAPFGADDVIFTWHAILNKKNNIPSTVGYDVVTAIDKRDEHTIAVHLRYPSAPFVATFFAPSSNPYTVLPAHLLAHDESINQVPFNSHPVGTGPFIVDRWQRGNKIVFRANPHYWRGPPKLAQITYSPVPDENTVITLLRTHEADLEYYGAAKNYDQFVRIPGTRTILTPFTQFGQIALNTRTAALSDVRVRRALWYALDTRRLIRDVSLGVNVTGYTDQPDFSWAYNPHVAHYGFDPGRARALLDAAGWKTGADGIRSRGNHRLSLVLAFPSGQAVGSAAGVVLQRAYRDVGVEVQLKTYVTSLFFATYGAGGILQSGKFDLGFFSWLNGTDPDDSVNWMCDQFPPAGQNIYHFCDPALDRQERIALASNDRATRKRAYDEIQRILSDNVPAIITWYVRRISIYNTDLRNYRPAHAVSSFWNCYEWQI